jgi:hypothetical protein
MRKEDTSPRFGPEHWVTLRDSGEHVKVEVWSSIAAAYRVRSKKLGVLFATDDELDEVPDHPEMHLGKHWNRCQAPACGAPLTPGLTICDKCQGAICTCGRCRCARTPTPAARAKTAARKKAAPAAK